MSKSKTRFNAPRKWKAVGKNMMQEDCGGYFVRIADYNDLLAAYKGSLCQLKRAGERIKCLVTDAEEKSNM